jgi:hypothetical protein
MAKKIFLNQAALVLVSFVVSQILLAIVLHFLHYDYFNALNWSRWDSGHYIRIATTGYELFPCAGHFGYPINATEICGNTGWFPGYPFLIKLLGVVFKDKVLMAGILSKLFYLLSLFMVLKIAEVQKFSWRNLLFVSMATFSFSFIYFNAIFPISVEIFFILTGLYFYLKRNIWLTGLNCFLASFFYPSGFLLAIVFAISAILKKDESIKSKVRNILIPGIMGALGILSVFLIFEITVDDWSAFMRVQAKYGHNFMNPIKNIGLFFKNNPALSSYSINNFSSYQSMLIILGYILTMILFFVKRMFRNELYLWTFIFISLFLIFPWAIGGPVSRYRSEGLLLPFVFLLKDAKAKYISVVLFFLLLIGLPMCYLFFNSFLV